MQLRIRQRFFSWTDSYDVYDSCGNAKYEVRAQWLTLGHQIHVYEKSTGREVGSIHQRLFCFLPQFEILVNGGSLGMVKKEFSFFKPRYRLDYLGWEIEGDFLGWDYCVKAGSEVIMRISKELFQFTDTYSLDFMNEHYEIPGLLLVIAIDAANCSDS